MSEVDLYKHNTGKEAPSKPLVGVLPVGPTPVADAGRSARIEALNENLNLLCGRLKVPFIDVFRPLADWIDYVLDQEQQPLTAWVQATRFDFEPFVCREEVGLRGLGDLL